MKVLIILADETVETLDVNEARVASGYVHVPRKVSVEAVAFLTGHVIESTLERGFDTYMVGKVAFAGHVRPMLFPCDMPQHTIDRITGDWLAALYDREVNR